MKYAELNLDPRLQAAIDGMGYKETTPIQEQTIPHILAGRDVAGLAQTGTGKTAAFLIPLIERILRSEVVGTEKGENTGTESAGSTDTSASMANELLHERAFKDWKAFQSILVIVPTRELADQIHENAQKLLVGTSLKSYPLYGGTGYEKQKEALKNGLHFIISTPGRLIDLYKEHFVDFKRVRAVVFDEADRMFDMGFKDDMKYILGRIERNRQFLVFSATLNFDVLNTAYQFGAEPVEINISRDQAKAENVKDALFHIGNNEKPQHLLSVIKKENPRQTIIFTNFKNNVDRIANFLTLNGIPAMGISSLMSQSQRTQVMAHFKAENNKNVLVATDVAARGLDINDVDLVINYELPQDSESYVHRIGRTGRAGKEGKAFSFVSEKDVDSLTRIEDYTKKKIDVGFLENTELLTDFKPMTAEHFSLRNGFSKDDRGPRGGRGSGGDRGPRAGVGAGGRSEGRSDQRFERGPRKDHRAGQASGGSAPVGAVNGAGFTDVGSSGSAEPRDFDRKTGVSRSGEERRHSRPFKGNDDRRGPKAEQHSAQQDSEGASKVVNFKSKRNDRKQFDKNTSSGQQGALGSDKSSKNKSLPDKHNGAQPKKSGSSYAMKGKSTGSAAGRSFRQNQKSEGLVGSVKNLFKKIFG